MEDNKIIGFNLNLNFGFEGEVDHEVIKKVEDAIASYFVSYLNNTETILLSGKSELIRENNNFGISQTK